MRWICTFGTPNYTRTMRRFCKEAEYLADAVLSYTPDQLTTEMKTKCKEYLTESMYGYGYFLWKPDVIWQTLQYASYDDIVVYCDAGCTVQSNILAKHRFEEMCTTIVNILSFELLYEESDWTRRDVLEKFSVTDEFPYQLSATVIMIRKTPISMSFFKEFRRLALEDPMLFVGKVSSHRHDQSVYSCLSKLPQYRYTIQRIPNNDIGCIERYCILLVLFFLSMIDIQFSYVLGLAVGDYFSCPFLSTRLRY